jgi:crotonobetainyl-CoA:carnitine CoA-transferase CaiB-like acyl-CoA transferase
MPRLPLEGIRVIDLTIVWAGPFAAANLADMGAEVYRVESGQRFDGNTRAHVPDFERTKRHSGGRPGYAGVHPDARPYDVSPNANTTGRNKYHCTIDLTRPEGKEILLRLVEKCDVFVENNARDTIAKLGITYEVLAARNPRLIYCSLAAFGTTGPYAHFRAYGASMEAMVGHTLLRGYTDVDPVHSTNVFIADSTGGAAATFAVMAALYQRQRTGRGQFIDMSQAENMTHSLSQAFMDYSMNGRIQGTRANRDAASAPQGVYRCAGEDCWLALSCHNDADFETLCRAMGREDLLADERFNDGAARWRNQDALDVVINAWSQGRDHIELFHELQAAGLDAAPVYNVAEVFEDANLRARDAWQEVTHPMAGTHAYLRPVIGHMSKTPLSIRKHASTVGEDNEYVYKEVIGYSDEEYQRFIEDGQASISFADFKLPGQR